MSQPYSTWWPDTNYHSITAYQVQWGVLISNYRGNVILIIKLKTVNILHFTELGWPPPPHTHFVPANMTAIVRMIMTNVQGHNEIFSSSVCPANFLLDQRILTIIAISFKHLQTLGMFALSIRSSSWKRSSSSTPYSLICFISVLIWAK